MKHKSLRQTSRQQQLKRQQKQRSTVVYPMWARKVSHCPHGTAQHRFDFARLPVSPHEPTMWDRLGEQIKEARQ